METSPDEFSQAEIQLAMRNHGAPLEALRRPLTPPGLHYLLIHFDVPFADAAGWRVDVTGSVREPLSLGLDDLAGLPQFTQPLTMECAGNGRARVRPRIVSQPWNLEAVGTAEWTGVRVRDVLERAGVLDDAVEVVFEGADRGIDGGVEQAYARSLSLDDALAGDVMLAHTANGAPLLPQHGHPLRLVVPGWYGMTNVKWLRSIRVVSEPFDGYQQSRAYTIRVSDDDPGTPVTRMLPRSLMVPPGIPDFMTRERFVDGGAVELQGRAWSGWGRIESVDVSADGGRSWEPARLGEALGPNAWAGWSYEWRPDGPGRYELCSAATDETGRRQPLEPVWNTGGYCNNAVQRVTVTVRAGS